MPKRQQGNAERTMGGTSIFVALNGPFTPAACRSILNDNSYCTERLVARVRKEQIIIGGTNCSALTVPLSGDVEHLKFSD